MNANYEQYVALGRAKLAEKAEKAAYETEAAERERKVSNQAAWLAHLQPVFESIPDDLHEFISFDDGYAPTYWASNEIKSRYADFNYIPCVPIRIHVRRGRVGYEIGKAFQVKYGENNLPYLHYEYCDTVSDVFEAIAAAAALIGHNVEFEARLDDPAPIVEPALAEPTFLQKATAAFRDGATSAGQEWALLSVASSLAGIEKCLDGVICVRDVNAC